MKKKKSVSENVLGIRKVYKILKKTLIFKRIVLRQ